MKKYQGLHSDKAGCNLFLNDKTKRILSVLAVLVFGAIVLFFINCRQENEVPYERKIFAMDTLFSIKVYGKNVEPVLTSCEEEVRKLENCFSVTREGSDLYRLNQQKKSTVSEDTYILVSEALKMCKETDGALDISLYPVLKEWGFTTNSYHVPTDEKLQELLAETGFDKIQLSVQSKEVQMPVKMEMDLGAVAKGYTGDKLVALLKEQGVTSAILDLGGNVQVIGSKPDGSPFKIAVRDPFDTSLEMGSLLINDKCVITSGNYERFFTGPDGKDYCHILDPQTGYPADSGLVSVTVVGNCGATCDALSTALFVMGKDDAVKYWRAHQDFDMILITSENEFYMTKGLKSIFSKRDGLVVRYIQ